MTLIRKPEKRSELPYCRCDHPISDHFNYSDYLIVYFIMCLVFVIWNAFTHHSYEYLFLGLTFGLVPAGIVAYSLTGLSAIFGFIKPSKCTYQTETYFCECKKYEERN